MNYYNEHDPFAAAWLRELIKDGLIPDGYVDERSITEVTANELKSYDQCHFFAGIGGWSYALRLAGWPEDRPVWTGSPPCQPFSTAGKRKGTADERHLWPIFFSLIRECQPPTVFGEQVAAAIKDSWFDNLQADMEGEGYACGMVVLPACSVCAPHKRDRLWFVGNTSGTGSQRHRRPREESLPEEWQGAQRHGAESSADDSSTVGNSNINGCSKGSKTTKGARHWGADDAADWADSRLIYCRDGKYRPIPVEPSLFPLAHGLPNRVGTLRGAGNAIVPQVAAEVIKAFMLHDYQQRGY